MKILSLLLLIAALLANSFNSSEAMLQDSPELQEAETLSASAQKLYEQGKHDDAISPAKRALQIREKLLPPNDIRVSSSFNTLGKIYFGKKDYKAAREVFQRLLKLQEQHFGAENVRLAETLDWLAVLQYQGGNSSEAETSYKRALTLREKNLGANHTQVARSLFLLAEFYRSRRDYGAAVEHYRRALRLYAQLSSTKSADFERVSDGFYCTAYESGNSPLAKEISAIWKEVTGAQEPEPGALLNGRAISLPPPNYPAAARAHRYTGVVFVKVNIDEEGKVSGAKDMCKGPPYLSEAAVEAALKARFTPTKLSGMPVKNWGVITYNFVPR